MDDDDDQRLVLCSITRHGEFKELNRVDGSVLDIES